MSLRHRILSTASLVHRSILINVSYHKPGYHLFANRSSSPYTFGRIALRKVFYITHIRKQATSILRSAQMFVRYEAEPLPSLPDSKDIRNQILYYVHIQYGVMLNKQLSRGLYQSTPSPSLRPRLSLSPMTSQIRNGGRRKFQYYRLV